MLHVEKREGLVHVTTSRCIINNERERSNCRNIEICGAELWNFEGGEAVTDEKPTKCRALFILAAEGWHLAYKC